MRPELFVSELDALIDAAGADNHFGTYVSGNRLTFYHPGFRRTLEVVALDREVRFYDHSFAGWNDAHPVVGSWLRTRPMSGLSLDSLADEIIASVAAKFRR